ncbi:helix-turn-helix domain-containing protein [Streptomyces cinereoruber]|uniref:helix-turn-helix domain-containing protein n=1 Tax=Streptomyces cinereoruber TaxID=67260 RepID=UPI00362A3A57
MRKSPAPRLASGPERDRVAAELKARYEAGATIRALAKETDRSYAGVHRLLADAGTHFRPRGGTIRKGPLTASPDSGKENPGSAGALNW